MEVKLDERFDQLISCIKDLRRAPEQGDKSLSFDTMEANLVQLQKEGGDFIQEMDSTLSLFGWSFQNLMGRIH